MIRLAIDIGNTFIKTGIFEESQLLKVYKTPSGDLDGFKNLFIAHEFQKAGSCILSNVGREDLALNTFLRSRLRLYTIGPNLKLPIRIAYKSADTLGSDRIAAATYAWSVSAGNACLAITCGTCIIYDFIDEKGTYQGGAISPGLHMRLKSLNTFSARLPLVAAVPIDYLTGQDTASSLLAGVFHGIRHEIDGFIEDYRQKHNYLSVFLGGGDSNFFVKQLKNSIFATPNIVLEGLNKILLFNEQTP